MDYDAYDALLHHIFKQVCTAYRAFKRRITHDRCVADTR